MKALIAVITVTMMLGGQNTALGKTSEEDRIKKQNKREILSSEQDKLFKEGRLAEMVVKPLYESTDQLINTELIKKTTRETRKK
jgi:hypothetical protein